MWKFNQDIFERHLKICKIFKLTTYSSLYFISTKFLPHPRLSLLHFLAPSSPTHSLAVKLLPGLVQTSPPAPMSSSTLAPSNVKQSLAGSCIPLPSLHPSEFFRTEPLAECSLSPGQSEKGSTGATCHPVLRPRPKRPWPVD